MLYIYANSSYATRSDKETGDRKGKIGCLSCRYIRFTFHFP